MFPIAVYACLISQPKTQIHKPIAIALKILRILLSASNNDKVCKYYYKLWHFNYFSSEQLTGQTKYIILE